MRHPPFGKTAPTHPMIHKRLNENSLLYLVQVKG